MNSIPPEVVAIIFSLIPRFSVYDLKTISRVSHRWRELALGTRSLRPWGRVNISFLRVLPTPAHLPTLSFPGERKEYIELLEVVNRRKITSLRMAVPLNNAFPEFALLFLQAGVTELYMELSFWRGDPWEGPKHLEYSKSRSYLALLSCRMGTKFMSQVLAETRPSTVYIENKHIPLVLQNSFVTDVLTDLSYKDEITLVPSSLRVLGSPGSDPRAWDCISDDFHGVSNVETLRFTVSCQIFPEIRRVFPKVREFRIEHTCAERHRAREWIRHIEEFKRYSGLKFRHGDDNIARILLSLGPHHMYSEDFTRTLSYLSLVDTINFCHATGHWEWVVEFRNVTPIPLGLLRSFPYLRSVNSVVLDSIDDLQGCQKLEWVNRTTLLLPHSDGMITAGILYALDINIKGDVPIHLQFYEGPDARNLTRARITSFHPIYGCSLSIPKRLSGWVQRWIERFQDKTYDVHILLY